MWTRTDQFFEPRVRFGIRRPRRWRFTAPGWSPAGQRVALEEIDWQRFGRLPFVSIERRIRSARHPRPMLRVGCRPVLPHTADEIRELLDLQREALCSELEDVEILTSSFDAIVGGHRAAHVRFSYTVTVRERRAIWCMRVLARSYLVLAPGLAYTIGMSSSADERYAHDADFSAAISSIRIGTPEETLPGSSRNRQSA